MLYVENIYMHNIRSLVTKLSMGFGLPTQQVAQI